MLVKIKKVNHPLHLYQNFYALKTSYLLSNLTITLTCYNNCSNLE